TTTGNTYQWSVTGGVIQGSNSDTTVTVQWSVNGSGSITLKQTNMFGCDSTVSRSIIIQALPIPSIFGPPTVCAYKQYVYTAGIAVGVAYQWNVTGGTILGSNTDASVTIKWNAEGTGTVSLLESSTLNCDSTVSRSINIQPTPAPVIIGPLTVCEYKVSTYTTNTTSGNTYQWSVVGGAIQGTITDTIVNVKWNAAGTGSITLIQTNSLGCDSTVSRNITIRPTPTPIITGPSAICEYKLTTYTTTTAAGYTSQWNVTGGVIEGSNTDTSITIRWNAFGTGTIALKQTNAFGCDSTVNRSISILPTPVPVITGPPLVCAFKQSVYTTNTTMGNAYQWNVVGGVIDGSSTDPSVIVKWNTPGVGIVTLTQTNLFECDSTVHDTITIQPSPLPIITGPTSVCEFTQSTYTTNVLAGTTYLWNVTGGIIQGSNTDTTITIQWNSNGVGTITVKQVNSFGCDSTITENITIQLKPVPVIIGPSSVCEYKQSTYTTNATTGNSYQWNVTGGVIQGSATDTLITVKWNAMGAGSITLTQINMALCDSTVSRTLTIRETPVPVISGPLSVCEHKLSTYITNATSGNSYQWNVTGGVIQGNMTDTIVSVIWNTSGTGILSVKQTNSFGCDSTIIQSITIRPTPVPVIGGPDSACAHQQSTYSSNLGTGTTYQWNVTGGILLGSNTDSVITVKWDAAGSGLITLKQTNSFGCDSTVSLSIAINLLPVPVISGNDTICAYQYSVFSTPTIAGMKYKWTATGGTIFGFDTLPDINVLWDDNIVTRIDLTLTNSFGCDSSTGRDIFVKNAPIPIIHGDTLVCKFGQYIYNTDNSTGATFKWTVTGGMIVDSSADTSIEVAWGSTNAGQVRLLMTNPNGCDSLVITDVSIVNRVSPVIAGPDTVCQQKMNAYSVTNVQGHTYSWTAAGGSIQGSTNNAVVNVLWATTGAKQLILYERSSADCDTTIMLEMFVKPTPIPVITGSITTCAYKRGIYTTSYVPNDIYNWNITGGIIESIIADTQIHVKWNGSASGLVSLKQTNSEGCDSTVELNVIIKQAPIPVITGPAIVCAHRSVIYSTHFETGNTYQWTITGGALMQLNDTLVEVKWNAAGPGLVSLKVIASSLCDSTVALVVDIQPTPNPDFNGLLLVCAHSPEVYNVLPQVGHTYKWTIAGGTIQGSSTAALVNVLWGASGTGILTLQQKSATGCDSLISKIVQIKSRPIPVIQGAPITCAGPTLYAYSALPIGGYRYEWLASGGTIVSGIGTKDIQINWPQRGVFDLSLHVTDTITLCDSTVTLSILVDSVVRPEINATALAGCIPLKITFSGNQALPGYTYIWDFGNGNFSTNVNPEYVYTKPGVFNIKVQVSNSNGCKDSASTSVVANYIPIADFSYKYQNERIYAGEDTVKFLNKSVGGNMFLWEIISDFTDTSINPENIYDSPGFYYVKLITIDTTTGCEQSVVKRLEVRVRERLFVPNAFTPDGDGINDYFHVSVTNIVEFEVIIFDRWGSILYRSNDPHFKWDGTYQNGPVQADVYGFLITGKGYHGKLFEEHGTVTVLR
ncbi:MAG: T9SS type B sorting domain-containing protein, partial [Bacteroidota bacterium]